MKPQCSGAENVIKFQCNKLELLLPGDCDDLTVFIRLRVKVKISSNESNNIEEQSLKYSLSKSKDED